MLARGSAYGCNGHEYPHHNGEVREVENPGMKRADANDYEVGDLSMTSKPINQIARAASPD
jgi:hypothetical protein